MTCFDPSPLYLWPVDDAIEMLPISAADSPRARRLAVLLAEAYEYGQCTAVLRTLTGWARQLLHLLAPGAPGRVELVATIQIADAVAQRRSEPLPAELRKLLHDIITQAPLDHPTEHAARALAHWIEADLNDTAVQADDAWSTATELLYTISVHATDVDEVFTRCASVAHGELFLPSVA